MRNATPSSIVRGDTFAALLFCFNDIATNSEANEYAAEYVRNKIRQTVNNPEVAVLLCLKDYPIRTKRICMDTGYFEAFNRDNVTLVDVKSNPIQEVRPSAVRLADGSDYVLDVVVFPNRLRRDHWPPVADEHRRQTRSVSQGEVEGGA
jgi:cation diffusion facilitator CzcD-associated flavoprotein CzcO